MPPRRSARSIALAALAQTLVAWCRRPHRRAATLPAPPREWTVRENRWLAARYGIDAELIVEDPTTGQPERRTDTRARAPN